MIKTKKVPIANVPTGKVVSRGGAHYTVCDGKKHYDIVPLGTKYAEVTEVNWTCDNCKKI